MGGNGSTLPLVLTGLGTAEGLTCGYGAGVGVPGEPGTGAAGTDNKSCADTALIESTASTMAVRMLPFIQELRSQTRVSASRLLATRLFCPFQ